MTLIKELITIPEQVHQGDFVLKLADGVAHAEATLRDYVVTQQLNACFNDALTFIKQAVQGGGSKAAYLHGSFGAGKSHFMAVLNLLLDNNVSARSIPELANVVAQHNGWTQGRKFLLVPYHMIGARSMESAILGGYAEFVRARHPDAPVPGFYLSERLFEDAVRMRKRIGDEAFFRDLNAGSGIGTSDSGWGELSGGWDAASFEAAMLEPPSGDDRVRLVGDLISCYFTSVADMAESRGEAFVPLDDGLSIMSRHAKELGYDAVILFLDELILWLASRAADVSFVSSEGTKLVKLVEAGNADRPIPLVSFVARQRDLRELVGENLAGSLQLQFSDVLRHWEARFHRITLEDRNLPAIAEKRVLRPVSEAARQTLSNAFDEFQKVRPEVWNTLLTETADKEMFRKVYPFSPALVQTLIAVSAALQRERTALKLMLQLLVDRRDDLELGQIIPVGDLFDVIADGDEPFSEAMRIHFDNAKRLYKQKLLPHLERQHGVTWENIRIGDADPAKGRLLRNDARLIKTLLLSALVPEVDSLKALTAQRLAALNHGTIRSPIPGRETQDVLRKCKEWAADIGEIKVTDDTNSLISIQVTGVDIEPIVRGPAASSDNPGNRRRRIREMLFEQLGVTDTNDLFATYPVQWRGTRREVEVLYENVREMSDEKLRGRPGSWTVVIDFPFDDQKFTPADDLARLAAYQGDDTQTLVWMPSFFSAKAQHDLGRLVVLDYILTGERFNELASHLALVDRGPAQALLKNQRDQLQQRVRQYLEVAYGIAGDSRDAVVNPLAPEDQFRSLDRTLTPQPPVGANLKSAFEALLDQLFRHQFPAHPVFDVEVKSAAVKKVWPELERAIGTSDGRALVGDRAVRQLIRSIADPVQLGKTGETHFVLDDYWRSHFLRSQAKDGAAFTVGNLRKWMDEPLAMGLPAEVQNLIILTFAGQTNRSFVRGNVPYTPSIDQLPDDLELREQTLPELGDWETACKRAATLFGLTIPTSRNAGNVAKLVEEVLSKAREVREPVSSLVKTLNEKSALFSTSTSGGNQRLQTARSALALVAGLISANGAAVIVTLAQSTIETSEVAMRQTLAKARELDETARTAAWEIFDAMKALADERKSAAQAIVAKVSEVLAADEHVMGLKGTLDDQRSRAVRLLTAAPPPAPTPLSPISPTAPTGQATPPLPPTGTAPVPQGDVAPIPSVVVQESAAADLESAQALELLDDLHAKLDSDTDLRLSISWRLEKRRSSK
ncbi:MAG TPA: phage resistance protein [Burkholderiaceae bacterium]|nr:phage resistance protein [Burkholderiaceae bacterium]